MRPIGAVSPSRIWSRPWPLARSAGHARQRELPVDDRRGRHEAPAAPLVLRRQPARLVGLVAQRPARDPREHAAALVLVRIRARVAPAQCGHERPVVRRPRLARRLLAALAARRPRRHRRRGRQDQAQPADAGPAHEVVVRVPQRRRVGARVGRLEAARLAARRQARPQHERAHAVGAQGVDVVERRVRARGAQLQQLVLVLEDRFLAARGRRGSRGGQADRNRDQREPEQRARPPRRSARRPCPSRSC